MLVEDALRGGREGGRGKGGKERGKEGEGRERDEGEGGSKERKDKTTDWI